MRFEFATSDRIVFGPGSAREVVDFAAELGCRACLVKGGAHGGGARIEEDLAKRGILGASFAVRGEPTPARALEGVRHALMAACDMVIAVGGGSVIDTGKAVAALLTNPGNIGDYLEVIGEGKEPCRPPAPCIAVPTTSGTGAEVTRNAVLLAPEHRLKISMRGRLMLPRLAVVDPLLTLTVPPAVTAATGLDALTQLMESYVSSRANPLTDGICREGMRRAARSLRKAYENGGDAAAREEMSLASLFGGLALANAGLGAAHGFAAVLGGAFGSPHGALCARLLPSVMEANIRALGSREPGATALSRYAEIGCILTGRSDAGAAEAICWVRNTCEALGIPALAAMGLTAGEVPEMAARARRASSMKGNPVLLTDAELEGILREAL